MFFRGEYIVASSLIHEFKHLFLDEWFRLLREDAGGAVWAGDFPRMMDWNPNATPQPEAAPVVENAPASGGAVAQALAAGGWNQDLVRPGAPIIEAKSDGASSRRADKRGWWRDVERGGSDVS